MEETVESTELTPTGVIVCGVIIGSVVYTTVDVTRRGAKFALGKYREFKSNRNATPPE